jgi:hypothetical protein
MLDLPVLDTRRPVRADCAWLRVINAEKAPDTFSPRCPEA